MVLAAIQHQLQNIYDLSLAHRVDDFLTTDNDVIGQLDPLSEPVKEKLLVLEDGEDLFVSLYLADELLDSVSRDDPYRRVADSNLAEFCTAIEGVSHFVYLTWNAGFGRPVSQLELEVQAEVDKFVALLTLLEDQGHRVDRHDLWSWLFSHCRFHPRLAPEQLDRYRRANRYASRFCDRLETESSGGHRPRVDYRALRRFYRKRHREKFAECRVGSGLRAP